MSAEAAQVLILKRDRDTDCYCYSDRGCGNMAANEDSRQSTKFWDAIAQKWPQGRFSSFFTCDHNA